MAKKKQNGTKTPNCKCMKSINMGTQLLRLLASLACCCSAASVLLLRIADVMQIRMEDEIDFAAGTFGNGDLITI